MLDATGNNYEYQSSAFTEAIKTNITTMSNKFSQQSSFGTSGKITFLYYNFSFIGQNVTVLANNTPYVNSTLLDVGLVLRNSGGYTSLFDTTGRLIAGSEAYNLNISVEIAVQTNTANVKSLRSYIQLKNGAANLDNSLTQGVRYRTAQNFHDVIYYSTIPLKYLFPANSLYSIILATTYDFATLTGPTACEVKFILERNVW
jgi:hypothetical protein